MGLNLTGAAVAASDVVLLMPTNARKIKNVVQSACKCSSSVILKRQDKIECFMSYRRGLRKERFTVTIEVRACA